MNELRLLSLDSNEAGAEAPSPQGKRAQKGWLASPQKPKRQPNAPGLPFWFLVHRSPQGNNFQLLVGSGGTVLCFSNQSMINSRISALDRKTTGADLYIV